VLTTPDTSDLNLRPFTFDEDQPSSFPAALAAEIAATKARTRQVIVQSLELLKLAEPDIFLSTPAGLNWSMLCQRAGGLSMDRRSLILGVIASSCFEIRAGSAWPLVTRQQSRRDNAVPHKQAAPAAPQSGTPIISIEEPNTTTPIRSPVRIRVTFQPASNAKIDVNSFRVRYGSLGIDITRRILAHARPTASGVTVNDAELPRGRHRVTIQIADNLGRVGIKSLEFTVV
jgi:hypothetical protein